MIVRAGASSLHPHWIADGDRNWDLALSCYQDGVSMEGAEYVTFEKGPKWIPLHNLIRKNLKIISTYDYICLADDDLMTDAATWNNVFDTCREYELLLAQPALTLDSYITHSITRQDDSYFMRFTNFVEVMCPVFSRTALQICVATMGQDSKYGWGQDFIWPLMLSAARTRIAVIDRYPVRHTRPVGHSTDKAHGLEKAYELMRQYGLTSTPAIKVYGGLVNP